MEGPADWKRQPYACAIFLKQPQLPQLWVDLRRFKWGLYLGRVQDDKFWLLQFGAAGRGGKGVDKQKRTEMKRLPQLLDI